MQLPGRPFRKRAVVVALVLVVLLGMIAIGTSARPVTPVSVAASPVAATPLAYPPSGQVFGATYTEWSARYWQWLVSLPVGANPAHDASGSSCGYGQSGPVFFIPPNLPPCAIPAGTAVMVHLAGTVCSNLEDDLRDVSEHELRACAAEEADRYANVSVLVDGEPVPDIGTYRVSSAIFPVTMPEPNIHGATGGIGIAAADGYWMILPPMVPGEHEVILHLELADGLVLPDETLRLSVVDPSDTPSGATPVS